MPSARESYGTPKHVMASTVTPMVEYVSRATIDDVMDEDLKESKGKMSAREPCVTFGLKRGITCGDSGHRSSQYNDLSLAITEPNGALRLSRSVQKLAPFIRLMRAVECIHFCDCLVSPMAFKWIVTTCENLRCLRFDNIQGLVKTEWTKFVKPLSAKLIHFSYAGNTLNDWRSLAAMVLSFALLESLAISDCVQDLVPVFRGMSQTVDSLTISRCDRLNARAVRALKRSNGPQIRFLAIDFTNVTKCLSVIQAFYDILGDSLLYFKATNIAGEDFSQFTHNLTQKSMTNVFATTIHC
ncbi:unnamed protein product [Oppiella nova]|uniref:Uncharacterized protein n=1 Tax=Oppiella nova TaxID=334625 RepID=A0A7R9QUQ4_9ACAR|nr:unnamed protein product [Oppiella nova]CAG2175703.1 unnamed protein product [Oppiella nova]